MKDLDIVREIYLRGKSFYIHDNDDLSGAIERNKDYWESDILDYIKLHYPVQKSIVDVGANIGNHSFYFANYLSYDSIFCFEPIEDNFLLLLMNMTQFPNLALLNAAASSKTGKLSMRLDSQNSGSHTISDEGSVEIQALTIDRVVPMEDVTLLKIDAEGHEPEILDGASDTLYRCRPLILMEDGDKYCEFLPEEYKLVASWEHHRTYMYEWVEW